MSGTPKYSYAELRRREQERLEAERKRRAAEEARRRAEAEARERQRRLEEMQRALGNHAERVERSLTGKKNDLPADELSALTKEFAQWKKKIGAARTTEALAEVQEALLAIEQKAERLAEAEARRRAELLRKKTAAEHVVGELAAVMEGLRADEVVQRWQYHRMAEIEAMLQSARSAIAAERYEEPAVMLEAAKRQAADMVEKANAAQLKADKRDYIAESIRSALTEMGYVVSAPAAEHASHPASAIAFRAADAAGRTIAVSVPVEGEVFYTVDGFPHTAEALVDGGTAPACDQAEATLNQMRQLLAAGYGVDTSEILWEGKADPNRRLRKADALPTSSSARRAEG